MGSPGKELFDRRTSYKATWTMPRRGWPPAPLGIPPSLVLGTCAALSIGPALHPWWADAHEGADEVLAQHPSGLAVVQSFCTLIQICNQEPREPTFNLPALSKQLGTDSLHLHCSSNPFCLGPGWLAHSMNIKVGESKPKARDASSEVLCTAPETN